MQDLLEQALAHHRAARFDIAEPIYREILRDDPNDADALHFLGTLAFQQNRHDEALSLIDRAISLAPSSAEFRAALGQVLFAWGNIEQAIGAYREALRLDANMPDVHYNLGSALLAGGQAEPAVVSLHAALKLRPSFPEAFNNLGSALRALGRLDESAACYQKALSLQPGNPRACVNLGQVLKTMGQLEPAIACFDRAIALDPNLPDARSGRIYTLHYHPAASASHLLWENVLWNQWHAKPLRPARKEHDNDRLPNRKLRVGYVSPDFRDHVAGLYLLPLFREHDRGQFEIYAYSNVIRADAMTERFRDYSHAWRDISRLSDEQVDRIIREDKIDILIDTTLHMGGNRLLLFARRPAPIQVTFCGYPGTTGLETMDYRLSDPYLDPPGLPDAMYAERTVRLPHSFWCYEPTEEAPAVSALPASKTGFVTFGCLNNFCKVNDGVLKLWARVMQLVQNSRLLLLAPAGSVRRRVLDVLGKEGIDAPRISFVDHQPRRQYLQNYGEIDIALDTFPYNGHTTSLDAFWMGVPVVTLIGQTVVGRAGYSQLSNLNLTELAATDADQFVKIATDLANERAKLADLRAGLRTRMQTSPLIDARGFAQGVERAYRAMWEDYRLAGR